MKRFFLTALSSLFVFGAFAQIDSINYNCFNNTEVRVLLPSNFYMNGDKVEAEIVLIQNDSNSKAEASIKEGKTITFNKGKANYTTIAFGEGKHEIEGYVSYFVGDKYKRLPFRKEYTVYNAAANITAVRMNVLYIGIENPITVTVPGYPANKVVVTIANGELVKDEDNNYIAKVYKGKEARISVSLKTDNGKSKSLGTSTFRILHPPKLYPILGNLQNGEQVDSASIVTQIKGAASRLALTTGASFPFTGLNFKVGSYTLTLYKANGTNPKSITISGEVLNQEAVNLINTISSGDKIIIDAIKVAAPDEAWSTMPFVITVK